MTLANTDEFRLYMSGGRTVLDRISESMLQEFVEQFQITEKDVSKQFEHFAAYITIRRHYSEGFDTDDVVTGAGDDTGIDAIAILVNGALIPDIDAAQEEVDRPGNLDVSFIFVQAETSSSFDSSKITTIGFGVGDFFKSNPSMRRNQKIQDAVAIMELLYKHSSRFASGNPTCRVYYVTTGKWVGDINLEGSRSTAISLLANTHLFRDVSFIPVDADMLQRLYRQTTNAIASEFQFPNKTALPEVAGVNQAFLGYLPAKELLKIVSEDSGDIIGGLFYDNVRDWLDYNPVNSEIKATIETPQKALFALMNNGVTIIARNIQVVGNKFRIEDYQVVNGCQTCHVLHNNTAHLDESVAVPVKLIGTQDEEVVRAVILGTNRQTEVTEEQFFALQEFPKHLEEYFSTFPDSVRLFYERRTCQYNRHKIEKTRIVTPKNTIKAFGGMFLDEPHQTTRNYKALSKRIGKDIFAPGHRLEPYYVAALALYRLEFLFRSRKIDAKFKPARFHILMAMRMFANSDPVPRFNAREMARFCKQVTGDPIDLDRIDSLLQMAVDAVDKVAQGDYHRDSIRTEPFTEQVKEKCRSIAATGE